MFIQETIKPLNIIWLAGLPVIFVLLLSMASFTTPHAKELTLTDAQINNIVRRSYQHVAMYNVDNKFAMKLGGWNTCVADTKLKDHTTRDIARPNNDTLCIGGMLDQSKDPVNQEMRAFDSRYVAFIGYHEFRSIIAKSA